ncbi:MAG: T9SS type A sorting domain-containing protein, partial [Paludibacteraceae bacterium]|nr:T9SS type A sorting domain-containing protein [Paludibacteraceae bacterium]
GCDSTITLTLNVMNPCQDVTVTVADSIFLGDSYLFIDTLITPEDLNPVVVTRTIPRVAGCDSTITLTLNVMNPCSDTIVAYTDSIYVGDTYLFIDTLIAPIKADTVTCQRTIPREGTTCDSTINLTLIAMRVQERDTLRDTINVNRCYKEAFTDRLVVTYYPTQDTTVLDTIVAARTYTTDSTVVTVDSIYRYELKVWPAMTTTEQTDSLCATYGSFTWSLGSRDSIITDFVVGDNHREYMYQNILGCDSAKFILDVAVWPAMTTTEQTDSLCATYGFFTWKLGSRDSIITDFVIGENHREYMYQNILGCDSAKFVLDVAVWPAMTTTEQTDSLCATYGSFTWSLGSRDSIITDFEIGENHREYMYQNILGCDSAKFVLDVAVWPAMTTTEQTDSLCATYGSFTWSLGSRDSIITDFEIGENHREYMYQNILGCDSAKFVLDVKVWPATVYPTAKKDTTDSDMLPYIWTVEETGHVISCDAMDTYYDTLPNMLGCDSVIFELDLVVRTVERREAAPVDSLVCKGTEYQSRLFPPTHTINGLTEWQDSLRVWDNDNLLAIDSIYTYSVDIYTTQIPSDELTGMKAFCDYTVDYSYAWLNVAEYVDGAVYKFAAITDTIWEVETTAGWQPAATTVLRSSDKSIRVRCTVVTECETTTTTSAPFEVKMATADDKEELTIPASQKYGNRIIMVDKNATEGLGWTIPEADVVWYKVVGDQDDRSYNANPATWDDQTVKVGSYYVTRPDGNPLEGSYYALISGAMQPGMTCGAELRTRLLVCEPEGASAPKLTPNMVAPHQPMELTGLNATKSYTVRVVAMDGSVIENFETIEQNTIIMNAAPISGMYIVNVVNDTENVSLKYIVK